MKHNLLILFLFLTVFLTACSATQENELSKTLTQVEDALEDTLEDAEKLSVTKVLTATFSDDRGNPLVLYFCTTTYYAQDPSTVTGLNTEAISAVFDPGSAVLLEEFTVEGHPAAIYQGAEWNYACWTSSPEATGIMRYDPDVVSLEDVHRTVESVYVQP